jgi:hypothetical protein
MRKKDDRTRRAATGGGPRAGSEEPAQKLWAGEGRLRLAATRLASCS